MNRATLFQPLEGKKELIPHKFIAKATYKGDPLKVLKNVNKYREYTKAPNIMNGAIDYSSRRGVLPCFSINTFVGRNPPKYDKTHGLTPLGGQSRTQAPSVVNKRPLDIPIQIPRSSINAGINTPIKMIR